MRTRAGRVLLGVAAMVALVAATAAPSPYAVRPGDTLSEIAARFQTTVARLVEANRITNPDRIYVGQSLTVPRPDEPRIHVVARGETLSGIASRVGTTVRALMERNGITEPNRILAGMRLHLDDGPVREPEVGAASTHVVARGETLSGIALRYGTSVAQLARENGISNPNRILAGTRLVVPGSWHCPVRANHRFVNDFGLTKPGGRFHDGVDIFAARGAPAVAPVGGVVEHLSGPRGGLQYRLQGDDGFLYIGTHLDAFGESGRVRAGTVIGYVGNTGNARGTSPHLHFEIHPPDADGPINPYPTLVRACR